MANRNNTFLIKRSNVAGNKPTAGQLLLGELALNTADAILYTSGTTANSILPIGWDRVYKTGDTMTGTLYVPTISATTYQNLPTDIRVTGGTYDNPTGTASFVNNTGGTFSVTGFTTGSTSGGQTENFNWKFSTTTTSGDPSTSYFRANNATPSGITELYVSDICDQTGFDVSNIFSSITGNFSIYIQQTDDATKFMQFNTSTGYTDNTGWWTIPVAYVQSGSGGLFTNNSKCTFYLVNKNGTSAVDTYTTGFTYSNNLLTIKQNQGQPDLSVLIDTMTGLTATTISATTYQGLPISVVSTDNLFSTGLANTGLNVTGASNSNFFGRDAGNGATDAANSNFMGRDAGRNANTSFSSNFMGYQAGYNTGGPMSNGAGAYCNLFGYQAGYGALTNIDGSNFFGRLAGYQASSAWGSNFFGWEAGYQATNANNSNFFQQNAGWKATNANNSSFFGEKAGEFGTNANDSNFFGQQAGSGATNANSSNFFGNQSGKGAISARNSNLFGYNVGNGQILGSLGSNNIIIGTNISLASGTTNSINIGGVLFGTGTYSTTTGNPSITGQTTGKIGINIVSPVQAFEVSGGTKLYGGLTANTISATTYQNLPTTSQYKTFILTGGTGYTFTSFNTVNTLSINKTTGSTTTVILNQTPSVNEAYIVKDRKGDSNLNQITVSGGIYTIDGNTSVIIKQNNKPSLTFLFDGEEYIII